MSNSTEVKTFIDEAGLNCLVRNLRQEQDNDIALLCGLPIPAEHVEFCRDAMRPFYDIFCKAAPPDATRHITDAFASDDESWRKAAEAARQGIFELVRTHRMFVIYAARRARIARKRFDTETAQRLSAVAESRTSCYRVPGLERPNRENILWAAMTQFSLCTNEFLKIYNMGTSDFYFDRIDDTLAKEYEEKISELRTPLISSHSLKRRNLGSGETVEHKLAIEISTDREIPPLKIGELFVLDKEDPLIFAVDVIANSLLRHLRSLSSDALLNMPSSINGWHLEENTFLPNRCHGIPPILDEF